MKGYKRETYCDCLDHALLEVCGRLIGVNLSQLICITDDDKREFTYVVERDVENMPRLVLMVTRELGDARMVFDAFVNEMETREELYQLNKPKLR